MGIASVEWLNQHSMLGRWFLQIKILRGERNFFDKKRVNKLSAFFLVGSQQENLPKVYRAVTEACEPAIGPVTMVIWIPTGQREDA